MGWRFRKSFKILPGFRLNIGKRGISGISAGPRGFTTNIGKRGIFQNLGISGTGLSFREKIGETSPVGSYDVKRLKGLHTAMETNDIHIFNALSGG